MGRPLVAIVVFVAALALAGCGPSPAPSSSGGAATIAEPVRLTPLARRAVEELRADPVATDSILTTDPETWWATITVDLPIGDDLEDPLAALPPPLDGLAPGLARFVVVGDGPDGPVGARLEPPFAGLREWLDGSNQVVTTVPGDDPPSTATWPVDDVRITELSLTVVDFDATSDAAEIVAAVSAGQIAIGPAGGAIVLTLAEARAGVPATNPPLTGTPVPRPVSTRATSATTGPVRPDPGP